jgi:diguanylate cyclase (GGDEF)-like protein/PAS domain S-box-containing protein
MPEHENLPDQASPGPDDALLANALASVANAIFITDPAGHIRWANHAFSRLSGYAIGELLGHTPALMKSGMQREAFYADLWRTILGGKAWRGKLVDRRKDGELYTVDQTITPLLNELGVITHFIAIQQVPMTPGPREKQDHYLARHDALTGLPNRLNFREIERQQIEYARGTGYPFALMFLDLDKFKEVNDSFGHSSGDQLLLAVAERLTRAVRQSDTVARFGGDEFAILLSELPDQRIVAALAEKLNHAMAQPFVIGDKTVCISASIGAAIYPVDGDDPDDLMRKADEAMYRVKKSGGNGHQFYNPASPVLLANALTGHPRRAV